jgi:ATP-dependent DNA helicase RecG
MMQELDTPVRQFKGVGPKVAEHLAKLDLNKALDLLFHLPMRYEDRTRITPMNQCRLGNRVMIEGVINHVEVLGRKPYLLVHISDGSGSIGLRFIHYMSSFQKRLLPGLSLRCFGELRPHFPSGMEMVHPEYSIVENDAPPSLENTLTPIYPTTQGLSQKTLRRLVDQALNLMSEKNFLPELLPEVLLKQFHFPTLMEALLYVHRPAKNAEQLRLLSGTHRMQQRLAFEELVAHHLSLQKSRKTIQLHSAPIITGTHKWTHMLLKNLPFELTGAQRRVIEEINADLAKPYPMLRLVQGDVGSGKTIVAGLCALRAIEQGHQVALMAPTEILAEQHLQNFTKWFSPFGIEIAFLTGKISGKSRVQELEKIAGGTATLIIGTHALFQETVSFSNLAFLIIDEQHRFGVHQRLALKEKGVQSGQHPHQLIMTATPIPRTLAMTAYSDLDCSIIDELPKGRKPITTVLIPSGRRAEIIERLNINCQSGRQAYWVCTLIEESELLQAQAAEVTARELQVALPNLRIGLVHGKMSAEEKSTIMLNFKSAKLDILVATTVIEVGVDVPNANLMIIENPERLGLAQLHQLRGRVGRGSEQSHCVLLYQHPLSMNTKERLSVMRESNDGFIIAEKDLEMRGPGEILGTKQSGLMNLRVADLIRDKLMLDDVQAVAKILSEQYPESIKPIIDRWLCFADRFSAV